MYGFMRAKVRGAAPCAAAALLASLLLAGCSQPPESKPAPAPAKLGPTPDVFRVHLDTSKGAVVLDIARAWAPHGVDHFYELVKNGYYDGNCFYRVVPRFVVQFGINGDPRIYQIWSSLRIPDDPVKQKNRKGTVTFATFGPGARTTQVFVNMRDNLSLDRQGFAPIGRVAEGMDVLERLYGGYGDMPPRGSGPDGVEIERQGNAYLENHFPRLDYIVKATVQ
jgi:peptidyl-prolyl cis-trans isomerase A (cyclophilin A)